jgi:hypothetical protein
MADMATIGLQVDYPLGAITSKFEIADLDMSRILTAYSAMYGQVDDGMGGMRDMTPQEIIDRLAIELIGNVKSNTREWERVERLKQAELEVQDIPAVKVE